MFYPRLLVVTSCTGEKRFKLDNPPSLAEFKDPDLLKSRSEELAEYACPATQMYAGLQHLRVREGIDILRRELGTDAVDLIILSAGYGLIPEERVIVPYEVTFNAMKGYEVDEWARMLKLHDSFEQVIEDYDLILMLLGEKYLRSLRFPVRTRDDQSLVFLASKGSQIYLKNFKAKTFVLPLSNAEAKRYGYGLVGLKGFLFKEFAEFVVKEPEALLKVYDSPEKFEKVIDIDTRKIQLELPLELPRVGIKINSQTVATESDSMSFSFLPIPELPPAPNLHLGMQYFIPEWDDLVDPGFNFLTDTFSPDRDPYVDELYAHQIYPSPNYDGILVSKVVIDKNQKKKEAIQASTIHQFIRFQGQIMGDCGAFGYIKEDEPPYQTAEILDYYQNLGFDLGVSIDHLIVGPYAREGVRETRYEITLKNAEEFLQKYRERGYQFIPIGVAQGWSPESYAQAVKELIGMGYDYIALGGLARAQSKEILSILKSLQPHLTSQTRMHLFGVGRIYATPAFRHLGVTSFDSASPLRSAWLDSNANYHTRRGETYAAVRIPKVEGSGIRIKRILAAGISDQETLKKLEEIALHSLRKFDAGQINLEETLYALLDYDELLELPRDGAVNSTQAAKRLERHAQMYRKLLEDKPWKDCDCPVCQEIGVEVIIFRGNDRNRRRGFHNTYVFYQRFQDLLKNEGKLPIK